MKLNNAQNLPGPDTFDLIYTYVMESGFVAFPNPQEDLYDLYSPSTGLDLVIDCGTLLQTWFHVNEDNKTVQVYEGFNE